MVTRSQVTYKAPGILRVQNLAKSKPIDRTKPLPYLTYRSFHKPEETSGPALHMLTGKGYGLENPYLRRAYAKAYDKFVESALQDLTMQMGANLGEAKSTLDLIANRGGQLLGLARDLRRGNVPKVLLKSKVSQNLVKDFRRKHGKRGHLQVPGGWWLEYHFAWSPLIGDIYTGMEMLSQKLQGETPVVSRGTVRDNITTSSSNSREQHYRSTDISAHCKISGFTSVTNKNLYLANRMGLINPLSVAWEITPFSWAIDWFLPVSGFLSSYTDSVGWKVDDLCYSFRDSASQNWTAKYTPYNQPVVFTAGNSSADRFERQVPTSLVVPGLFDRRGTGIKSLTRGATAIALLVGFLRKNP